jgi:repressor LexA
LETTKRIAVPASVLCNHPNAQAALVVGDCMDKVAPEGMAVVYDPVLEPSNGKVVIVETEDHEATMRRWYRGGNTLMLVADSHAPYDDIVITDNRPIRVIGTVGWIQSPEEL